ncbi:MAG: iron-sulfur cluster assembly accessory protein [Planctomycetes bacterium]|nr:iron-sulfur cluster assembly accessory protein [Planctomycetota bacterium]
MSDSATETTDAPTTNQIVTLTESAQERARHFLKEEAEEGQGESVLRVGVSTGGCSGFEYVVKVGPLESDDIIQTYEGFRVAIDPVSKQFIDGSVLNYIDTVGFAGFKFENPQAKSNCGCGKSFDYEL